MQRYESFFIRANYFVENILMNMAKKIVNYFRNIAERILLINESSCLVEKSHMQG